MNGGHSKVKDCSANVELTKSGLLVPFALSASELCFMVSLSLTQDVRCVFNIKCGTSCNKKSAY